MGKIHAIPFPNNPIPLDPIVAYTIGSKVVHEGTGEDEDQSKKSERH